jgi:cytochrome P450 family 4
VRELAKKNQRSYRLWVFHRKAYCVIRAKDAEKILNSAKHLEKSNVYDLLHPFLKTGLLTSSGEKWYARRKLLTPAFHFNILKEFCDIFKYDNEFNQYFF